MRRLTKTRLLESWMELYHSGKGLKADAIDSPLGSTAIGGAVCTLVVLRRGANYRTIQTVQRVPTDLPETVLEFDATCKRLSLGPDKSEADIRMIEANVINYLQSAGDAKNESEIAEQVEGKTGPKRKALRALVEQGQVQVLRGRQESAKRRLSRWMAAHCALTRNPASVWSSEESLYRDYAAWCEQYGELRCSRDLFNIILDESFQRERRGWHGLCLAVDLMARKGLGSKPMYPPLATEVLQ